MENQFEYLATRAKLFFQFLEENNIREVFPFREESKKELEEKISSGSIRKLKLFNNLLDNLIVGKSNFKREEKIELLNFLAEKLGEKELDLVDSKIRKYHSIKSNGFIKSRVEINDAIEIANSDILGLSEEEKVDFKKLISNSMLGRI